MHFLISMSAFLTALRILLKIFHQINQFFQIKQPENELHLINDLLDQHSVSYRRFACAESSTCTTHFQQTDAWFFLRAYLTAL